MHKKNTIIGIVLSIVIIFLVFWSLHVDVSTVPVATIRFPKISWIEEKAEKEEKNIVYLSTQTYNKSGLTYVCPNEKKIFKNQDILCEKPPNYLPQYKNPCWYPTQSDQLSCLPYFLQIGVSKCATTDLFTRLVLHPDIVPINGGGRKSMPWWNLRVIGGAWKAPWTGGKRENLTQYVQYFSEPAKAIEKAEDANGYHRKITGEGSPTYAWMLYLWQKIPQNTYLTEPNVLVPHLIRHILPNVKLIVTLRDPVERMYSSYLYLNREEEYDRYAFHTTVIQGIKKYMECKAKKGERLCSLDPDLRATMSSHFRLLNSMYYLFIKEWLAVFPREQFLFIKMEEYVTNKEEVLNRVFKFLGVSSLTESQMEEYGLLYKTIKNRTRGEGNKQYVPMLNETREMLYKLYDPYTKLLPQLLEDPAFVWPKVSYEEYVQKMEQKRLAAQPKT